MTKKEIERARKVNTENWVTLKDSLYFERTNYYLKGFELLGAGDKMNADIYAQLAKGTEILIEYIEDVVEEIIAEENE